MYFIVKYIEYPTFSRQSEPVSKTSSIEQVSMMSFEKPRDRSQSMSKSSKKHKGSGKSSIVAEPIIEVIVDNNKEVLVNPDCFLGSIIDYIREVAAIPKTKDFKFCTLDGTMTELSKVQSASGLAYFQPKETYCTVLQEDETEDGSEQLIPLLDKRCELYSTLLSKLKQISTVQIIDMDKEKEKEKQKEKEKEKEKEREINKANNRSRDKIRNRATSRKDLRSGLLPPIKHNN